MFRYLMILCFCCIANLLAAQTVKDSILIRKSVFGPAFTQHNVSVLPGDMVEKMQSNPQAVAEMKLAKKNYNVGMGLGFTGGTLIAIPVVRYFVGSDKPFWLLAGIGGGVAVAAIPFARKYNKHATNAVNTYNSGLTKTGYLKPQMHFGLGLNGASLRLDF
ncbi:MAG: hypothetical protein EOP53_17300 [Sphingobacteriales bacterium]|nr:MAG: hypothetical protein EOP53_17300 [Sphingobacteriales bacterium]